MKKSLNRGFTLIELLIVIAIIAAIMAVGVPGLTNMSESGQMRARVEKLKSALELARSEAVSRRVDVAICASVDGVNCRNNNKKNWESGWIMWTDADADGAIDVGTGACDDGEDCILSVEQVGSGQLTILSDEDLVQFKSDGSPEEALSLRVCSAIAEKDNDEHRSRELEIRATGAVSIKRGTDKCY